MFPKDPRTNSPLWAGAAILFFGAYRFVDATTPIQNNPVYQFQSSGQSAPSLCAGTSEMLIPAGVEYHKLLSRHNKALIMAGVGLVVLALGFLDGSILRIRRKTTIVS